MPFSLDVSCAACGKDKPVSEFGRTGSGQRTLSCSECRERKSSLRRAVNNARSEAYNKSPRGREKRRERYLRIRSSPELRKRARAHAAVYKAVKRGDLQRPDSCPVCGSSERRIEGHHKDYSKPLEVDWVCSQCHADIHRDQQTSGSTQIQKRIGK